MLYSFTLKITDCFQSVSGKYRTTIPILYQLPFCLGNTVMAGLAYWLRDWRKLEFGLATLSALFIFYWFTIPESPRWLLAMGHTEKALGIPTPHTDIQYPCDIRSIYGPFSLQKISKMQRNLTIWNSMSMRQDIFWENQKLRKSRKVQGLESYSDQKIWDWKHITLYQLVCDR